MADEQWPALQKQLAELVSGYAGRVEYGNLRLEVYESANEGRIALAYETPGGSTNQFGITFTSGEFHMLDATAEHEIVSPDPAAVTAHMAALLAGIPEARAGRLRQDIDQLLQDGSTRREVLSELNRLMRLGTEFRGGSLTVDELTAACRFLYARTGG
ncbi:MAG: hypothetical protein IT204_12095 [Fimbriimonadaceae bacterium]|nr:hypothetical protein [Fimbriimonadaceae bacterium]